MNVLTIEFKMVNMVHCVYFTTIKIHLEKKRQKKLGGEVKWR